MDQLIATIEQGKCKVEIYDCGMPGQFTVRYFGQNGELLTEEPLSGVSSYHQREQEIRDRLSQICKGEEVEPGELSEFGEY